MKNLMFILVVFGAATAFSGPNALAATTDASAMAAKWCEATPGATRDQLVSMMGKPVTMSDKELVWTAPPLKFMAFLEPGGTAKQLEIATYSLSQAQVAALPCKPVRSRRSMMLEAAAAQKKPHTSTPACELVTPAEMSSIMGARFVGKPEERPGESTQCTYRPAAAMSSSIELKLTWGDGAAAMKGMALAEKREPGVTTPYSGIGDQAGVAGPLLLIRTGDDLMTMVFNGVSGTPAQVKRIFDTAKARM